MQTEVRADTSSGSRHPFDVVAYAPDAESALVPVAVVEVKSAHHLNDDPAAAQVLAQLAVARDVLGTTRHYLYDGAWHEANKSFSRLEVVDAPELDRTGFYRSEVSERVPPTATSSLVTRALDAALAKRAKAASHTHLTTNRQIDALIDLLEELAERREQVLPEDLRQVVVPHYVLWCAARQLVESVVSRGSHHVGEWFIPAAVRAAMVQLACPERLFEADSKPGTRQPAAAGGIVLDPYCGPGLLLCDLVDAVLNVEGEASTPHAALLIAGQERDDKLARIARALLELAPRPQSFKTIVMVDSEDPLDHPRGGARIVISGPPMGGRLPSPRKIWGTSSADRELAAIHRCVEALEPSGRAVLLTSQAWLHAASGAAFRQHLAHRKRVTALVGLPANALMATGVRPALIAITNSEPGPALVAELGHDWKQQLVAGGDFITEYDDFLAGSTQ